MADKPVYSTGAGGGDKRSHSSEKKHGYVKSSGPAKMRLETKGRGGKAVTVVFNIPLEEAAVLALMKDLQASLGCGATLKDGVLEFRGDQRARIEPYFVQLGLKLIRAGG